MEFFKNNDFDSVSSREELQKIIIQKTNEQFKNSLESSKSIDNVSNEQIDALLTDLSTHEDEQLEEYFETQEAIQETTEGLEKLLQNKLFHTYKGAYGQLHRDIEQEAYHNYAQMKITQREQAVENSLPIIASQFGPMKKLITWLAKQ